MSILQKFDFNHKTGIFSIIFVSIAVSLIFFSLAYMIEGVGWISAYDDEAKDFYLDVGWNWVRGSGIAFGFTLILLIISIILLIKNRRLSQRNRPLFGKLDLNGGKGILGLIFLAVSFIFFLNGGIYRIETTKWFNAALRSGQTWFLNEASSWATSSFIMILIGILLSAIGWILIAVQWKKHKHKPEDTGSSKEVPN